MRTQVTDFWSQFNIPKSDRFLLAISGGMDSVALAHLLYSDKIDFGLAHFNYQLRGDESDQDERFVQQLAAQWDIPFHRNTADTRSLATQQKKGIQETARELRYQWFQEVAASTPYDWIITAHHLNDSIESLLLNLTKGTGLRGMRGIPPINQNIIRPLISCSKEEIKAYVTKQQIAYREDSSNEKADYQRNYIRLQVIPKLKTLNPSLENTFLGNFKRAQGYLSVFEHYMQQNAPKLIKGNGNELVLDGKAILECPAPETVLFELIREYGFNPSQITNIVATIPDAEEARFMSHSHLTTVKRYQITVLPLGETQEQAIRIEITEIPSTKEIQEVELCVERLSKPPSALNQGFRKVFLDANSVQLPLIIRNWQQGDRFQPLGMNGKSKKLSDCFTDWKLNSIQKKRQLLVVSGDRICWVIGRQIDHRFAVNSTTTKVIQLHIKQP